MDAARREEIIRIARQISSQSLQLKGIVDKIARKSSACTSEPPGYFRGSQSLPQQASRSSSRTQLGRDREDVTRVESQNPIESSDSFEGIKLPTTTHISRRAAPPPPPPTDKEPDHPRPYEDDPIWSVWESNMLRLMQLLKMLLLELRNVSDYTQMNSPAENSVAESLMANKLAASRIIGGFQNREQVSRAMNSPSPMPQLYPPPPKPAPQVEERPGHVDLGSYFTKLAVQMDALTNSLKPNPSPPHAGAPMKSR
ncbi:unnamed protein product [Ixodes hexagonus]